MLLLGFITILLIGIPIAVYFAQTPQDLRSRAEKSTVLSFSPTSTTSSPIAKKVGDSFDLDVMVDPGKNVVSFIKLVITYDPTMLATSSAGACGSNFCPNQTVFGAPLAGPEYAQGTAGKNTISATFSVGGDPTKQIQSPTRIVTLSFKALSATSETPTQVGFDSENIQILSTASSDATTENVFSSGNPAFIVISSSNTSTTPTLGPTSSASSNKSPTCTSLAVDRATTGTAPYSITFTVNGTDSDGTIQQVTFNYGDGPVENVLSGGGIGTKTVSLPKAHTYANLGTYTATAILTDNNGATSVAVAGCSQTITVTAASSGSGAGAGSSGGGATGGSSGTGGAGSGGAGIAPTTAPIPTNTPIPAITDVSTLKPGPSEILLGIGALGVMISIIGAALFLSL